MDCNLLVEPLVFEMTERVKWHDAQLAEFDKKGIIRFHDCTPIKLSIKTDRFPLVADDGTLMMSCEPAMFSTSAM